MRLIALDSGVIVLALVPNISRLSIYIVTVDVGLQLVSMVS